MSRIILTHLTFAGGDLEPASVQFDPRFTLIRGPSDTGKSFIVDAIDFMLGSSALKEIPERQGYTTVLLGLTLPTGEDITLSRSVSGGNIGVYNEDLRFGPLPVAPKVLGPKHNAKNDENISRFLLGHIDLDKKRVRKNAKNATDSLSFRNIAHLCVVDETQMQAETSPALTGSYVSKTKEISVLKLLLQDEDDSDLIETPTNADRSRLSEAKVEVIDRLIADLELQLNDEADEQNLRDQLVRLNNSMTEQSESIERLMSRRDALSRDLTTVLNERSAAQRRISDGDALSGRLSLLLQQYNSDLARLEMIGEAGSILGFFERGTCVFCGAEQEHQHFDESCEGDATYFAESVEAERQKTTALRDDLIATLSDLAAQGTALRSAMQRLRATDVTLRDNLDEVDRALKPHRGDLADLLALRTSVERTIGLYDQISNLWNLRVELDKSSEAETITVASALDLGALREFSSEIQQRLSSWGIPDAKTVRYDRAEQDLIAGDQLRAAHGKGVRAILHAAFSVGLLQYCLNREIPHPGFVILDSPLVTYRPPDLERHSPDRSPSASEQIAISAFYEDLQTNVGGQILIMENTDPPNGLYNQSSDVVFTKVSGLGRYGFFSQASATQVIDAAPDNP